jgi:hypothetical protein
MKIGQVSPVRSGSTLVYNIIRELFPQAEIIKSHHMNGHLNDATHIIITVRHPFDAVISFCRFYGKEINDENIDYMTLDYLANNGNIDIIDIDDSKLILKYEDYYKNYDYIYNHIEKYFKITIPNEKRKEINDKYNITNVKHMAAKYENYKSYDDITHIHGNHISCSDGNSVYQNILTDKQKEIIFSHSQIRTIMDKYNYVV